MRTIVAVAVLIGSWVGLSSAVPVGQERVGPAPLWNGLDSGAHGVGFIRWWELDRTRVWGRSPFLERASGEVARPVRVDLWYPVEARDCERMPFEVYHRAEAPDSNAATASALIREWDARSYRGLTGSDEAYARLMRMPTAACRGAPPGTGPFPLVVYSAGWYNRSPDNAVLAEFLASHGYVVATVPQLNPGLWTYDFRSTPSAIETQMRDVEVALGAVIGRPYVDRTRVALMGYSTGGAVALLVQGRHPLVDAVVGLDPSYAGSEADDVRSSPYFGMYRNRTPILTLRSGHEDFVARRTGPSVLDSLHLADRLTADVGRGVHGDFSDDVMIEAALGLDRSGEPRPTEEGLAAYRSTARAVREFLDATLRGRGDPSAFLAGGESRDPLLRIRAAPAADIPTTAGWVRVVERDGVAAAVSRFEGLRTRHPGVTIVIEGEVNSAGYRLLRSGKAERAVSVFRFNAGTHPASANVYDSLADGCVAAGDDACTIHAYERLLEALPGDSAIPAAVKERMRENAEAKLKALSSST